MVPARFHRGSTRGSLQPERALVLAALLLAALVLVTAAPLAAQARVLDDFDPLTGWTAQPSDGVSLTIHQGEGYRGHGMRLDFDFHGGGGYAIAHKTFAIALPANYEFSFYIRGSSPPNNLEFKLIDSTGDNVWWSNQRDFEFPSRWRKITRKKRHITFAWGPAGGGEMKHVAALELVVTAGSGGKGSVWIDELTFTPLEPVTPYDLTPTLRASSAARAHAASLAMDGDSSTAWQSGTPSGRQSLTVDFLKNREYGGLTILWAPGAGASSYVVETSADGRRWDEVYSVEAGDGGRDDLFLPESESRYVRLRLLRGADPGGGGYAIRELTVHPIAWAASLNAFYFAVARRAPRGSYPKYFADSAQSYWTVVGAPNAEREALVNEEGMVEVGKGQFSLEPFLYTGGRLITWADVRTSQHLAHDALPIPSVRWAADSLALTTTAFVAGGPDSATLFTRYRVRNRGSARRHVTLYLTLRPFQVNPPWQFLNTPGGTAEIREIAYDGRVMRVNGGRAAGGAAARGSTTGGATTSGETVSGETTRGEAVSSETTGGVTVIPVTAPADAGVTTFDAGILPSYLRRGVLPAARRAADTLGRAAGALAYPLDIPPGEARDVVLAVPFGAASPDTLAALSDTAAAALAERRLAETTRAWRARLGHVSITLPTQAARVARTLESTLAYILINQDGPAIQPGSRSYDRAWIRDGALMSAALLRLGRADRVRDFIEWYAPYQYESGKIPCCVDDHGAGPVPESDSNGEFIYLVMEYYRFTGDSALLRRMWPHVVRAVAYLDSLRHEQMTPEYRTGELRAYYGLLPQSISHEGYSAKPMHSYWDDLFALRGLKDAAAMARVLGKPDTAARFADMRDEFRADLMASFRLAMQMHHIDYLPGSVELGDFDPTSTTIGVAPVGELANLPRAALRRTFDEYWEHFVARRDGTLDWESYTPYELRAVGTFVRLGQPARAHALLRYFLHDQRPAAWNEWAEVVWRDPRTPRFIGDMPHTWVGSGYIRSVLDMFAYAREADSSLVIGAGVPASWTRSDPGVVIRGLRTPYGALDLSMRGDGDSVRVRVGGTVTVPPGGVVVRAPFPRTIQSATVGARAVRVTEDGGAVLLRHLPAEIVIRYRGARE